jgi:hypothetical protein
MPYIIIYTQVLYIHTSFFFQSQDSLLSMTETVQQLIVVHTIQGWILIFRYSKMNRYFFHAYYSQCISYYLLIIITWSFGTHRQSQKTSGGRTEIEIQDR